MKNFTITITSASYVQKGSAVIGFRLIGTLLEGGLSRGKVYLEFPSLADARAYLDARPEIPCEQAASSATYLTMLWGLERHPAGATARERRK